VDYKGEVVTDANGYTWAYPARAPDADVDSVYYQCGSLIPPKADWWGDERDKGEERRQSVGGRRLPLVPIEHREDLGCLAELYGLKTGAELGICLSEEKEKRRKKNKRKNKRKKQKNATRHT
jgi:hypothetical protein